VVIPFSVPELLLPGLAEDHPDPVVALFEQGKLRGAAGG